MATATVRLDSRALRGATTYSLILPDPLKAGPGPYHVLLQLHGMHDDHSAWLEKARLWNYVERLPLIVVLPSGGNFWWSNFRTAPAAGRPGPAFALDYEDYLMADLWPHIQANFPVRPAARWAIGGLSMGGFGAIRLGLKYPAHFCSIFAHSSVLPSAADLADWLPVLAPEARADMDPYRWADARTADDLPRLGFDCGLDDYLLPQNRRFHAHLESRGLPHTYAEHPGAHTWDYWDLHVQQALIQHCQVLGLTPFPAPPPPGMQE